MKMSSAFDTVLFVKFLLSKLFVSFRNAFVWNFFLKNLLVNPKNVKFSNILFTLSIKLIFLLCWFAAFTNYVINCFISITILPKLIFLLRIMNFCVDLNPYDVIIVFKFQPLLSVFYIPSPNFYPRSSFRDSSDYMQSCICFQFLLLGGLIFSSHIDSTLLKRWAVPQSLNSFCISHWLDCKVFC